MERILAPLTNNNGNSKYTKIYMRINCHYKICKMEDMHAIDLSLA